jgi:hypothetical protein
MAIAVVSSAKANGADTFSVNLNTVGANCLVVCWSDDNDPQATVSDDETNDWISARSYEPFGPASRISYAYFKGTIGTPITTSASHDITLTGTGIAGSAQVYALSGVQTSSDPLDQVSEDLSFGSGTVQPVASPPLTPTTDGQFIVTHFELDTTPSAPSIDGGFSTPLGDVGSGGTYLGSYSSYLIQTTAAGVDPTWTRVSGTNNNYSTIASFKAGADAPATAPAPVPVSRFRRGRRFDRRRRAA